MIINDLFNNKKFVAEGMAGKVVFSGTGADGGKYEIIQSSPTDFMIHANGKHIDTYSSLQRAMSVLQNEVPGLQQGMSEAIGWEPEFDKRLNKMKPDDRFNWDRANDSEYSGQPMTDFGDNWSGDRPVYAPVPPETLTLQDRITGKVNNYSFDSPEAKEFMKHRFDSELGPDYKGFVDAFKKGADFNANRPKPYTNLATSDSTNDFTDPIKLGQYDVDFPEQTVINPKNGEVTTIPSPNNPTAPYQKPAPAASKSTFDPTKFGINPNGATSQSSSAEKENLPPNSTFYVYKSPDQKSAKPVPPKAGASKAAPIPAKPKPGSWQELAKLNNITDPRKLQADTYIKTPDGGEVFVKKGDTLSGIAQKMRPTGASKRQGMAEDDGFDVVSNYADMRSTEKGGKSNQTFTSTAIAKNPATGQQQSLAKWDHTDPATGKNYSGSNYIDAQGNAEVQKNYEESKNKVNEVSLGDYSKKAMMSKAMAQTNRFFGRDDPAAVAAADRTIANRTKGLAGADARRRPYTTPPVDQDKQRRDLADKYPNIDELVRRAELNRDPDYDRAEGNAYYAGRDAEHRYHKLKQIQRMIRGTELDEMDFGGVGQVTDSDTSDVTTSFNQGPVSVSQTKTPGGYTKQTDQQFNLGNATLAARTVGPNIGAGQLAGTTTKTATNTATGQAKQQVKGVGFGGATGANVGKNYVGSSDDELAKYAADSTFGVNEETKQATLNTPVGDFTANITKDKSTNTVSGTMPIGGTTLRATKDMTPGGAQSFSVDKDVTPNLNLSATKKSADYNKGQLAGTRSVAAKYTDATGALGQPGQQHTATRTIGVGFGGASGANVGKNYVDQYSVNESIDRIRHLAGIKPVR